MDQRNAQSTESDITKGLNFWYKGDELELKGELEDRDVYELDISLLHTNKHEFSKLAETLKCKQDVTILHPAHDWFLEGLNTF